MTISEQIFAYKELEKNGQAFFVDTYEDCDRIIEALEKQIPKKPSIKPYFDAVCCPVCMETIYSISIGNQRDKYCHNCGQRICWGEGE